jgi:FixJ family two-component response regulator
LSTTHQDRPLDTATPCVAVVDDDESLLRSLGRLLRSAGYKVETFGSGQEFLDRLPDHRPGCLVLDVHMAGMTGIELHDRLRAEGADVPVVLITAYETPQSRQHAQQASTKLLLKPFDKHSLLLAINDAVGSAGYQQPRVRI